jgi:diacylglycerol kinase
MRNLIRKHTISFKHAFDGILWAVKTQPNFRIHLTISVLVLLLAWFFRVRPYEWMILVFAIIVGLSVEMVNTAIEAMTDLITKEYREEAKIAKDVSAGMMLVAALGTAAIGLGVFLPYLNLI